MSSNSAFQSYSRGRRMVESVRDKQLLEYLYACPKYESTKTTTAHERDIFLRCSGHDSLIEVQFTDDKVKYNASISDIKLPTGPQVGDVRQVKWKDGRYYKAKIVKLRHNSLIEVRFTDDKVKYNASISDIKLPTGPQVGDVRQVKWKNGRYYKAKIVKLLYSEKENIKKNFIPLPNPLHLTPTGPQSCSLEVAESAATARIDQAAARMKVNDKNINYCSISGNLKIKPQMKPTCDIGGSSFSTGDEEETRIYQAACLSDEEQTNINIPTNKCLADIAKSSDSGNKKRKPRTKPLCDIVGSSFSTGDEEQTINYQAACLSDEEQTKSNVPTEKRLADMAKLSDSENIKRKPRTKPTYDSGSSSSDEEQINISVPTKKCLVDIAKSSDTNKTKRIWDKRYLCCFCNITVAKIARHLELKHISEPLVAKFVSLPKNSAERLKIITKLRSKGNFIQNTKALKDGGSLVPKKRPKKSSYLPTDYLPCEFCGAFYSKKELNNHQSRCVLLKDVKISPTQKRCVRARSSLLLPVLSNMNSSLKSNILATMKGDEVFEEIVKDFLIVEFGNSLYNSLGHLKKHHRLIKDKLRELGRFMIVVKKIDKTVSSLQDIVNPKKYNIVTEAVKEAAGYCEKTFTFSTPSLAIKIGQSLMKCAVLYKSACFLDDILQHRLPEIEKFIFLMDTKWTADIVKKARCTLYENQWNKEVTLPVASDIKLLHNYLLSETERLENDFEKEATQEVYENLMEVCLVRSLVLNRRRVGETQYVYLKDFKHIKSKDKEEDIYTHLSETEKMLTKTLARLEIRGKRGRRVPLLIPQDTFNILTKLTKYRSKFVDKENPFLFCSTKSSEGYFRADKSLKKYALVCGAKYPENITSTRLRKHVATMVQLLNLKPHEFEGVVQFMGHDPKVHMSYYRMQESNFQLAKISKLLLNMEKGNIRHIRDKNLDEIGLNDEEKMEEGSEVDGDLKESEFTESHIKNDQVCSDGIDNKYCNSTSSMKSKNNQTYCKEKRHINKRNTVKPNPWSTDEINCVYSYFNMNIKETKLVPGKKYIEEFLNSAGKSLKDRNWKAVKYCIYNAILKSK